MVSINKFMRDKLAFKTYPKPGWDIYTVEIYFDGEYKCSVEVDGLELACWELGDADEEGFKKFEKPHKLKNLYEKPDSKKELLCCECCRREGWD
jgi:hypothetical protein